jgi:hypothetical protein
MKLRSFFWAVLLAGALATTGCGGSDESTPIEKKVCERLDECNVSFLLMSIQDCTEVIQSCSNDLLSSAYADWETAVNDCLRLTNCANFAACYDDIDVCYLADLNPGGGGGTAGSSSGGTAGEAGSSSGTAGEAGSSSGGSSGGEAGSGSDGTAGEAGSSSGGSSGGEAGSSAGGSSGGCVDGETECLDDFTVNYCDAGDWLALDCDALCVEVFGAASYSAGCMFDSTTGMDDCICVY